MDFVLSVVYTLLLVYVLVLLLRLVFDWIQVFARDWRPRGVVLLVAEAAYTVTDPPLRVLRRLIPPLRLGGIQLDLAYLVLMLACTISMQIVQYAAAVL